MARSSGNAGCFIYVVIFVVVIAITMVSVPSGNSNQSKSGAATQTNTAGSAKNPDANLTPQTPPGNGAILNGSEGGNAGVQVSAAPETNAYVKVKDASGYTVVGFYVSSGSTAQVHVPEGNYSVQFALGGTWYGMGNIFGSRTSFGQDGNVSLGDGDMITYSLQVTAGGNFSMQSLDGSQF